MLKMTSGVSGVDQKLYGITITGLTKYAIGFLN
jgi:hypothetical protein